MLTLEGRVQLTVKKERKSRSDNQNRYYWGVVIPIVAEAQGYNQHSEEDKEEVHEGLKIKFLSKKGPKGMVTVRSTTALSTVDFMNYIDMIIQWAAESGTKIPLPNEVDFQ